MKHKQVVYTVRLTSSTPIETDKIVAALKDLGEAEVTNYVVKTVKA